MFALLFSDANVVFSVAIGVVFGLTILELFGLLFGISLMGLIDDISPLDIDNNLDLSEVGVSPLLSWLSLDRLPLMIWLVLLLLCFGLVGYSLNFISFSVFGATISTLFTVPIATILGLLLTGRIGSVLARLLPKNESSAIDTEDFVGSIATITVGEAVIDSPAEAKLIDNFKQAHYIMVEPMEAAERFVAGDRIILVSKQTHCWQATRYLDN